LCGPRQRALAMRFNCKGNHLLVSLFLVAHAAIRAIDKAKAARVSCRYAGCCRICGR
jgi:hypothetical protein